MTQSRLSLIFIPCLRKLRALDLISPSLKVCGWVAGLAAWIPLWLWTGLRLNLRFLGFMWAWAPSRRTTGVLKFVLLKKLCFLGVGVSISFRGKALVINALALSRIWYVASLVHMPPWVLRMLNSLIFDFFWKTKCELVSRAVVVQPPSLGGFSVVNVNLKASSLLSQRVRRFAANPSGWTLLMTYWFLSCFSTSPSVVLARPHSFNHSILPAFYSSLLLAWRSLDGSFDDRLSSLVFAPEILMPAESWRIYLQK